MEDERGGLDPCIWDMAALVTQARQVLSDLPGRASRVLLQAGAYRIEISFEPCAAEAEDDEQLPTSGRHQA